MRQSDVLAHPPARIGRVAQRTGLSIDTVRFYEKQGLLEQPQRTEGGFRLYDERGVGDLCFIRSAQAMGFALAEIRELLALRNAPVACSHVHALVEEKLAAVRIKLMELRRLEQVLRKASLDCEVALTRASEHTRGSCPVLEKITQSKGNKARPKKKSA